MAYIPETSSVVAFQSKPSSLLAGVSVIGLTPVAPTPASVYVVNPVSTLSIVTGNTSVTAFQGGAWTTSVVGGVSILGGTVVVNAINNPLPAGTNPLGSVAVLQGTNPWQVNVPTPSYLSYQVAGSVLNVNVSGSVATVGTFSAGNTSVSAYVESTNTSIFALVKNSSITALQGTNPWVIGNNSVMTIQGTSPWVVGSVITTVQSSVAVAIVSGSVAVTVTPPANQSVSGTVQAQLQSTNASVITVGNFSATVSSASVNGYGPNGEVITTGSIQGRVSVLGTVPVTQATVSTPWIITGSIQGGGAGTQYGENQQAASVTGTAIMFKSNLTTSILSVVTPATPLPVSVQGTVQVVPGSVSGVGLFNVNHTGNGSIQAVLTPTSVAVLQGTNPWQVNVPTPSYLSIQPAGSVMNVNVSGSVATVGTFSAGNTSVSAFIESTNTSIFALVKNSSVAVLQGTNPWVIGNTSVTVVGGGTIYREKDAVTPSALGIPILFKIDETNSVLSAVSPQSPFPVKGSVAVLQGTNPWVISTNSGSVIATQIANSVMMVRTDSASVVAVLSNSSVAALQGTNPWVVSVPTPSYLSIQPGGSVINANISGSVAARLFATSVSALQGTEPWVIGSIVGTFAEDAAHTTADKGIFVMGVRNDAVSSFTSAERDYSPHAVDDVGRTIIVPFAGQQACIISYFGSVVSGSVTLIQASVIGSKSYVTDFALGNTGSTTTLVTIQGGDTSLLGQFVVPAGGGNNKVWQIPLRTTLSQDLAFKVAPSQSILYVVVKGYQAP